MVFHPLLENPYLNAFAILLGFTILAKFIDIVVMRIVSKLVKKTQNELDDKILEILRKPIFLSVIIIGGMISGGSLNLESKILIYLNNTFKSILSIIWGLIVAKVINEIIDNYEEGLGKRRAILKTASHMIPFLKRIVKISGIAVVLLIILNIWGIDVTPLLASAGIFGLAIAFAAKDTIANVFGGLSVFVDKPYKIGDYVIVEDHRGKVIDIGLRSTKIKTRDNILISIPNSVMATNTVINETGINPILRVRIPVGVSYDSDVDKVEKTLLKVAKKNEYVLEDPEPKVRMRGFGESSLDFELLFWIKKPALKGRVIHFLSKDIFKTFAKEGIEMPFPQRDVHLYKPKAKRKSSRKK